MAGKPGEALLAAIDSIQGHNTPGDPAFDLTEEQQAILDQADRFSRAELYGLSERMDADEWWPEEAFPKIGDAGLFGITIPEEYGGAGLDLNAAGLVLQAMARWNHALALAWVAHDNLCANNIFRNGTEAQRRKYLPGLCSGRMIGCLWRSPGWRTTTCAPTTSIATAPRRSAESTCRGSARAGRSAASA